MSDVTGRQRRGPPTFCTYLPRNSCLLSHYSIQRENRSCVLPSAGHTQYCTVPPYYHQTLTYWEWDWGMCVCGVVWACDAENPTPTKPNRTNDERWRRRWRWRWRTPLPNPYPPATVLPIYIAYPSQTGLEARAIEPPIDNSAANLLRRAWRRAWVVCIDHCGRCAEGGSGRGGIRVLGWERWTGGVSAHTARSRGAPR